MLVTCFIPFKGLLFDSYFEMKMSILTVAHHYEGGIEELWIILKNYARVQRL
jgi:hypothetical protein